jgi:hypothetical protein
MRYKTIKSKSNGDFFAVVAQRWRRRQPPTLFSFGCFAVLVNRIV